jgi:SAM-dependent methyltransferase
MSNIDTDLITWKTNAWKDEGMVKWYSARMVENTATNRLKNAIEEHLITQSITGHRVLDVGIGTGRGSLPLLRRGRTVTGIDSSQAMLDEARRLAGDSPIDLRVGDITAVPCDAGAFDDVFSLNVLVHFPNWQDAVAGWQRLVRPGGTIAFDIHTRENPETAYGVDREKWPPALVATDSGDKSNYMSRTTAAEVLRFAREHRMRLKAIQPYGAFLGGGNHNWLLDTLEQKNHWRRMLSWVAADDALLEFCLFVEVFAIHHLTPRIAGRMWVVLVNEENEAANDAWAEKHAAIDTTLAAHDWERVARSLPIGIDELRRALAKMLAAPRTRVFAYRLYETARTRGVDLGVFFGEDERAWLSHT